MALLRISAPQGVSLDYTTQQMQRDRGADPAAARQRRDRSDLRQCRAGRLDQQRLHGDDAGALGRARRAASRRSSPTSTGWSREVPGVRAFAGPAQQPRHPRRRQRPAVRARRQQLCASSATRPTRSSPSWRRIRASSSRGCRHDTTQPQLSVDDRPRARLRPRHRHHRPRRARCRPCSTAREIGDVFINDRSLSGEAGLDQQSDQRSDRPGEHLPEDRRRPLRADVDHRHADRKRRAARAGARAAAARRRRSPRAWRRTSRSATPASASRQIAAPLLPPGGRIIPLAEAATLGETNSGMLTIFGFALVIILLVLAAQFESFVSAVIIMATVPFGARLRRLRADAHRNQPQRLQPDRPGAAGRHHGQERHPDRRIRQPAARSRHGRARGDRGGRQHPPAPGR